MFCTFGKDCMLTVLLNLEIVSHNPYFVFKSHYNMLNIPVAELVSSFNKLTGNLYNVNNLDHCMLIILPVFLKNFVCKRFIMF